MFLSTCAVYDIKKLKLKDQEPSGIMGSLAKFKSSQIPFVGPILLRYKRNKTINKLLLAEINTWNAPKTT